MQKIQKFIIFILRFIFGKKRVKKSTQTETPHPQEMTVEEPLDAVRDKQKDTATASFRKRKLLAALIGIGVLGGLVIGFSEPARDRVAQLFGWEIDQEARARKELLNELQQVLGQVEKHMLIPTLLEEEPLLATVLDAVALAAQQPFYSGVIDGDKVLIYPGSLRAIIYSPERDIIVNVGPVVVNPEPTAEN